MWIKILLFLLTLLLQGCEMFEMEPLTVSSWRPTQSVIGNSDDWADLTIQVSFSKEIDKESAQSAFRLLQDQNQTVAGRFSWPNSSTLSFQPQVPLDSSHRYTFEVSTEVEDVYGNSLDQVFQHSFALSSDRSRPEVSSYQPQTSPLNGGQAYQAIELEFSKAMNKDSVYQAFSVSPEVKGLFSWSGNKLIFTPYAAYEWGKEYLVSLRSTAIDSVGNSMREEFTFRFSYGDTSQAPKLLSIQDATGVRQLSAVSTPFDPNTDVSQNWEVRDSLKFTFDKKVSRSSLNQAIQLSPYSAFDLSPSDPSGKDFYSDVFTLSFDDSLNYDKLYLLMLSSSIEDENGNLADFESLQGGTFYFRTNGAQSIPIEVLALSYLKNPDLTVDPVDIAQLKYASPQRMNITAYTDGSSVESFIDLHLKYASLANLQNSDFYGKIGLSVSGGATAIKINRLEMSPATPAPIAVADTVGVLRIHLGITRDSASSDSEITLSLDKDLTDSLGNTLGSDWKFLTYLQQN